MDAHELERREGEVAHAKKMERCGRDVGDDLHIVFASDLYDGAEFFLEGALICLRDMQGGEYARDAKLGGRLDKRDVFFRGVVKAGINGDSCLHGNASFH